MEYRSERVRQLLIREVSEIIRTQVKDTRVPEFLTITDAKVSKDMQHAIIYFGVMGDQRTLEKAQLALNSASNFIRSILKTRIAMRYTPFLKFIYDETIDRADRIETILKTIEKQDKEKQKAPEGEKEPDADKN
ncbi:MAG TPA: 30S ribosome-binding factor RbfA [Candidatus Wallbacteria bacterium]|nr:30S ribosome-binding factor RbfA [Candidatus Wallbacteria bacterium]